jgi:hypothetical protein
MTAISRKKKNSRRVREGEYAPGVFICTTGKAAGAAVGENKEIPVDTEKESA